MNKWVALFDNGLCKYTMSLADDSLVPPDQNCVRVPPDSDDALYYTMYYDFDAKDFVSLPPKPSNDYIWDYPTKSWVFDSATAITWSDKKRKQMLAQSDYTQLPDVPLPNKSEWATYRQALRDITNQPGYPKEIDWPTPPDQV